MQIISSEFKRVLANRLQVGELGKPRCRVEVDRLVFIPGKIEKLILDDFELNTEVTIEKHWIEPNPDGSYSGSTNITSDAIIFPVQGLTFSNMTSGYGMRNGKMHWGVDFAPSWNTQPKHGLGMSVVAAWAGNVIKISHDVDSAAGKSIEIVHSGGRKTRYLHLHTIDVVIGQVVSAGQKIGTMGNTGSVRSGGNAVTGSYSNPNSDRSQGLGTHLHFEIHTSNEDGNYKKVNPEDYFNKKMKAFRPAISQGDGSGKDIEPITGIPGRIVMNESFVLKNWHENKRYSFSKEFLRYSTLEVKQVGGIGTWNTIKFPMDSRIPPRKLRMDINITTVSEAFLDLSFRSNFNSSQGDAFYVTINDSSNRAVNITKFDGVDNVQEVNRVHIPKGEVKITIGVDWGGASIAHSGPPVSRSAKQFSIGKIKIQELAKTTEAIRQQQGSSGYDSKQEDFYNYQEGYWEEREVTDFIFSQTPQTFDLTVGDFVYSDTITLENVMNVDIATSLEQDTMEATITLSNIDGYYSPDYNPYNFSDLHLKSPFSSQMAGFQVGVLSNNTPVRIYMGYGNNEIRVFTGLIDKTDLSSSPPTMTISCRDMYKKISDKVLTETKKYPDVNYIENVPDGNSVTKGELEKVAWLKSAVVQDLIDHARMYGWRVHAEDLQYPDAIIEESYLISVDQVTGTFIRAIPDGEGEFEIVKLDSVPTPRGWLNPYVDDYGRTFEQYQYRVGECISEVLQDTHYRSYCDRYGTYRLETPNYNKEIVDSYVYGVNLLPLESTIDFSRARSHIIITDENGKMSSFMDKEILMELKGELRTASIEIDWAKTYELKKVVASRLFQDMKRVCRTLQVSTPCNPAIDLLDRVRVVDRNTSTNAVYTIKGIRRSYSVDGGLLQFLELFWSEEGQVF